MVGISAQETERPAFSVWLEGVRADAIARGIKPDTVARAFEGLEPLEVVVERDRTQAETVLTVEQYVQGGGSTQSEQAAVGADEAQAAQESSVALDFLIELYFPHNIVGSGRFAQDTWGLDITWEP